MKICYISTKSIHTRRWVEYFAEKGHKVHLITPEYDDIKGVKIHEVNPEVSKLSPLFKATIIRKLVKKIKPDVIHAHQVVPFGLYGALSGFHPFVVSAWGSDIAIFPEKSNIHKILVKYALKMADLVHTGDEPGKERLIELGCDENKILIQPMGIDTNRFFPRARSEDLRRKLGIEDKYSVLCARWFKPQYNIDIFIKAMPYVLKEIHNVIFIICGAGHLELELKKLVEELEINKNVVFTGLIHNEEMPKYLASIDVYVDTAIHFTSKGGGGIGVTTMEAMACETPQILAKSVSVNESSNWFHGLTYEPLNPKDLAKTIVYLFKNAELGIEIGKKSRETALEIGDWKKNLKIQENFYEKLTGGDTKA
jgi:glycosyltransferase involved in cell wall biosynthesis